MKEILQIRLLGAFSASRGDGELYAVHGARLEAFLTYLLLHSHTPQPRRQIAFAFWPDSTEAQSLSNLRKLLHELRQVLPGVEHILYIDHRTLHWQADGPFALDVAAFDDLLARANSNSRDPKAESALLEEAITHYRGDLLPNCYDGWILPERERLRHAFLQALERLIELAECEHEYTTAISHANHLLRYEPVQEAIYRRLMGLYLLRGDRASALNIYHTCATALRQELDVEPGQEMQDDYARLLEMEGAPVAPAGHPRSLMATRLVGREDEWQALRSAWKSATEGSVHLCLIRGEAGIGKSRLAHGFLHWVREEGFGVAQSRAYQMQGQLAYASLIDWLRTPSLQAALQKVDDVWLTELTRLLPDLLVERPDLSHPEPLKEGWQRQRIFAALARVVFAAQQPLVLFLDDAQWCDRETLEWVHYLQGKVANDDLYSVSQLPRPAILIVCTARSGDVYDSKPLSALLAALSRTGGMTEVELAALNPAQTEEMAVQLNGETIAPQIAEALFAYTEGNPLYIVETLAGDGWKANLSPAFPRAMPQAPSNGRGTLPGKIYATIRGRLAKLSREARQLSSLAAVIGRGFDFETLRHASQLAEDPTMRSLDELWRRGIVVEEAGGLYDFSHDRIRDVAYAEIGPVQRPLLHRRVAQALEARHGDDPGSVSGLVARHYTEARDHPTAIHHYMQAAAHAADLYIVEQALAYTDRALALLDAEPETSKTISQRIDCLLNKDYALRQTQGQTTQTGQEILNRAYQSATQLGDPFRLMDVLLPLRSFYGSAGDWHEASAIACRLVALAEEVGDPKYVEWANSSTATVYLYRGEFQKAAHQYKRDATEPNLAPLRYSLVPGAHIYLANLCWLFGYPDQAKSQALDAVGAVDGYVSPCLRIQSRSQATWLLHWIDERTELDGIVCDLGELCKTYGYTDMGFAAPFLTDWLEAENGVTLEGITRMQNTLEQHIAQMKTFKDSTYYLTIIAESQAKAGLTDAALESLLRARQISNQWGERFWLAEILRLTGEMQQRLGHGDEVTEATLLEALDIARQQGAKSLELRAATSLARFWQRQGRQAEAHALLADVYGWFTEGFDTPDLQTACALLNSLAASEM